MDKDILIKLAKDAYKLTLLFPKKEPLRYKIREIADDIIAEFLMKQNDHANTMRAQIETIDSFLDIAAGQDWTSGTSVNALKQSYARVSAELERMAPPAPAANVVTAGAAKSAGPEKKEDIIYSPSASRTIMAAEHPAAPMAAPENPSTAVAMPAGVAAVGGKEAGGEDASGEEGGLTDGQIVRQNRILEFLKEKGGAQVWEIQKIFPRVSKRTIRRDFRSMLRQGLIERFGERNTTFYKLKTNVS